MCNHIPYLPLLINIDYNNYTRMIFCRMVSGGIMSFTIHSSIAGVYMEIWLSQFPNMNRSHRLPLPGHQLMMTLYKNPQFQIDTRSSVVSTVNCPQFRCSGWSRSQETHNPSDPHSPNLKLTLHRRSTKQPTSQESLFHVE